MIQKSDIVRNPTARGQSYGFERDLKIRNKARQGLALKIADDLNDMLNKMYDREGRIQHSVGGLIAMIEERVDMLRSSSQGDTDKLCGDVNELRGEKEE